VSTGSINNNSMVYNQNSVLLSSRDDDGHNFAREIMEREKEQKACKERWDRYFSGIRVKTVDGDMVHRSSNLTWYVEKIDFLKSKIAMFEKGLLSRAEVEVLKNKIEALLVELVKLQSDCNDLFEKDLERQRLAEKIAELEGMKGRLNKPKRMKAPLTIKNTIDANPAFSYHEPAKKLDPAKINPEFQFKWWMIPIGIGLWVS
jgi:hypothetical protein